MFNFMVSLPLQSNYYNWCAWYLGMCSRPYFSFESQIGTLWVAYYRPFGKPSSGVVAESRTLRQSVDLMPDFKVDVKVLDGLITLTFFFLVAARGVRSHFPHLSFVLAVPGDSPASCKQCGRKVKLTYYKLMCVFVFAKLVFSSSQVFQLMSFICPN